MAYKMKGFGGFGNSPAKQKDDHPKKETPPEHKDLAVTRGTTGDKKFDTAEDIADLEDRIEFLQSDIEDIQAVNSHKGAGRIRSIKTAKDNIEKLKAAIAKLRKN